MPIYIPKVRHQSINEILTIKEYWNLADREPFLPIIWEPDFSQACSFRRMLKDRINFHFTPTPDKPNNLIFLKSPKNLVFWPFLTEFFSKKSCSDTCYWIWAPSTILSFKKTNEPILRKRTDRLSGGRRDARTDSLS